VRVLIDSSFSLQLSTQFGDSATNYISDVDNISSFHLAEIYQYDNAETFQRTYSIEMDSANTLIDNSEGTYTFTIYGTFIYE